MRAWPQVLALVLLLPAGMHAMVSLPGDPSVDAWIWSPGPDSALLPDVVPALEEMDVPFHQYDRLGMVSFTGSVDLARDLTHRFGGDVERNRLYDLHLDRSVPAVEADVVIDAVGPKRNGPSVLVIDTGVDSTHPDFQNGNLAANFAAERVGGLVVGTQTPDVVIDEAGHGTHVAGIVAGSGEATGDRDSLHGRYQGIYHNGRIVGFQALAENPEGDQAQVDTLAALEAMEWAIEDGHLYDVKVVQASWGTGGDLNPRSSVTKATLELYLGGLNVVFSAGNRGTEDESLNSFCQAPWVLCVANVDNRGSLTSSSSVGTSSGSYRPYAHPDIAAPGTFITATGSIAEAPGPDDPPGTVQNTFDGQSSQDLYEVRTGTSMAAPHISGAAALIIAANPDLSPDQVMDVLVETATATLHSVNEVGAGMLNVREAYNLAVQTPGNRDAFESGQQVKYGGPATGDADYSQDPISVGYTSIPTGNEVILPPRSIGDQAEQFIQVLTGALSKELIMYGGIGLGVLLLLWIIVGGRKRRRRRRERRAAKRARRTGRSASRSGGVSFRDAS